MTGKSMHDMCDLFLITVITGVPSGGMRAKVSLSCPAMAMRIRWSFLISVDVGNRPNLSSAVSSGVRGMASFLLNEW